METPPSPSSANSKLFLFALLLLPTTLIGVIPFLFLGFGFTMFWHTKNLNYVEIAVRNCKMYCWLVAAGGLAASIYWMAQPGAFDNEAEYGMAAVSLAFSVGAAVYVALLNNLVLYPMRSSREIFGRPTKLDGKNDERDNGPDGVSIDIVKGKRFQSFSVADELLKWAQLKEAGHITDEEFQKARRELLNRSV